MSTPEAVRVSESAESVTVSRKPPAILLAWLQLIRLPTVFTAMSNILCGYLITHSEPLSVITGQSGFYLLLISSAGLYLGGMVLNDVFDAQLDSVERPERPIPSGRITRRSAAILGCLLMLLGIAAAATAGGSSLSVAVILAVMVVAYDWVLKKSWVGSFGMGICRFLNIMLGASALSSAADLWQLPQVGFAAGLCVYIIGVTWFARNEAGNSSARSLWMGLIIVLAGIGVDGSVIALSAFPERAKLGAGIGLGLIAMNLLLRGMKAIQIRQPRLLQKTVGLMLLSVIFLDATVVFAVTGDAAKAAFVVILVIPATMLRKVIPMS